MVSHFVLVNLKRSSQTFNMYVYILYYLYVILFIYIIYIHIYKFIFDVTISTFPTRQMSYRYETFSQLWGKFINILQCNHEQCSFYVLYKRDATMVQLRNTDVEKNVHINIYIYIIYNIYIIYIYNI